MLRGEKREFVIKKIKDPLRKLLIIVADRLPDPTHENVIRPNSHILLDIRDKFFEYDDNPSRKDLLKSVWKLFIAEYEHDPYYRYRFDWLFEEMVKRGWMPRPCGRPLTNWNEPDPHGGFVEGVHSDSIKELFEKGH